MRPPPQADGAERAQPVKQGEAAGAEAQAADVAHLRRKESQEADARASGGEGADGGLQPTPGAYGLPSNPPIDTTALIARPAQPPKDDQPQQQSDPAAPAADDPPPEPAAPVFSLPRVPSLRQLPECPPLPPLAPVPPLESVQQGSSADVSIVVAQVSQPQPS